MRRNTKLIIALAASLMLTGCGGNINDIFPSSTEETYANLDSLFGTSAPGQEEPSSYNGFPLDMITTLLPKFSTDASAVSLHFVADSPYCSILVCGTEAIIFNAGSDNYPCVKSYISDCDFSRVYVVATSLTQNVNGNLPRFIADFKDIVKCVVCPPRMDLSEPAVSVLKTCMDNGVKFAFIDNEVTLNSSISIAPLYTYKQTPPAKVSDTAMGIQLTIGTRHVFFGDSLRKNNVKGLEFSPADVMVISDFGKDTGISSGVFESIAPRYTIVPNQYAAVPSAVRNMISNHNSRGMYLMDDGGYVLSFDLDDDALSISTNIFHGNEDYVSQTETAAETEYVDERMYLCGDTYHSRLSCSDINLDIMVETWKSRLTDDMKPCPKCNRK